MKKVNEYRSFIIPTNYLKILRLGCYDYTVNNITENTNTLDINPDTDFYDISRIIFNYTNNLVSSYEHLNYKVAHFADLLFMDDKEAIETYKEYEKMLINVNKAKIAMRVNGDSDSFITAHSKLYSRVIRDFIYKDRHEYQNDGIYMLLKPIIHGLNKSVEDFHKETENPNDCLTFTDKQLKKIDDLCDLKTLNTINDNLEILSIIQEKNKVLQK